MSTDTATAPNAVIDPDHAAELYESLDGPTEAPDEPITVGPWTLVDIGEADQGRWHERYHLVLRDEDGQHWGLRYGIGLTENQEDDLPWEDADRPLPLVRLYPREVTRTEWRRVPVGDDEPGKAPA